ncbi:hypothetical protein [Pseudomonas quasicaspiana]|uniref:hypothetical protein n=1 Tax=Pseudomonas quasicaspiana TaxID=2829821 RepID=UPI001E5FE6AA|nr:hypothetical protein [Pseudomonas quasicaspiana]MCD5977670.1 hypothetical protein [Pseudomonas quasicaspiana]
MTSPDNPRNENSSVETTYLLSNESNAKRLRRSVAQNKARTVLTDDMSLSLSELEVNRRIQHLPI